MSVIDVRALLDAGQVALDAARAKEEEGKRGTLRIGSSGVVCEDGTVRGTCHRVALARLLGVEQEIEDSSRVMFMAGEQVEDGFAKILNNAPGYRVLRSDDISIDHPIGDTRLLGRPDIVLADGDGKPVLGIEHKTVFSAGTATQVLFDKVPKSPNLAQMAAYSLYLGIPFVLAYTSPSHIGLNFYDQKKYGGIKSLKPFFRLFYSRWDGDALSYRADDETEWTKSLVTKSGIENYFKLILEMRDASDLGPRPNTHYLNGKENRWGENADCKFCPFNQACQDWEDKRISFLDWIERSAKKT
jgi:hypothetical protein